MSASVEEVNLRGRGGAGEGVPTSYYFPTTVNERLKAEGNTEYSELTQHFAELDGYLSFLGSNDRTELFNRDLIVYVLFVVMTSPTPEPLPSSEFRRLVERIGFQVLSKPKTAKDAPEVIPPDSEYHEDEKSHLLDDLYRYYRLVFSAMVKRAEVKRREREIEDAI